MNDTENDPESFGSALNTWFELTGDPSTVAEYMNWLTGDPRTATEYVNCRWGWDKEKWTGRQKQRPPSRKVPAVAVEVPQEETVKPGEEE